MSSVSLDVDSHSKYKNVFIMLCYERVMIVIIHNVVGGYIYGTSRKKMYHNYSTLLPLSFRGSKVLRIAIFEKFVEIICCMRTLHAMCQKFLLNYFHEQLKIRKIREIKDPRKFSAIRYYKTLQNEQVHTYRLCTVV